MVAAVLEGISCWDKCEASVCGEGKVVTMDRHTSVVETLLSKAEIPIIDLSHMGKWSSSQLLRLIYKKRALMILMA